MAQKRLIDREKVSAEKIAESTGVDREQVEAILARAEQEMRNHKVPTGGICILDAAKKYNIPDRTICEWVKRGYVPIIEKTSFRIYIDETKMAEIASIYKRSPGKGKWTVKKTLTK